MVRLASVQTVQRPYSVLAGGGAAHSCGPYYGVLLTQSAEFTGNISDQRSCPAATPPANALQNGELMISCEETQNKSDC